MNAFLERYLKTKNINSCRDFQYVPKLRDLEKEYILFLLAQTNYNLSEASRILHISRSTLYKKVRQYKLTLKNKYAFFDLTGQ